MSRFRFALLITVLVLLFSALGMSAADPPRWPVAKAGSSGIDSQALRSLFDTLAAEPHRDIKGVVVLRNALLAGEAYFNGDDANTLHDIRSATKSITATLMGIAIERGLVRSVDDSIAAYLPGMPNDGKQAITIRDLLNMRSGLDANDEDPASPGNEDRLDQSTDWIKSAYSVPMRAKPGREYVYCSLNAFLAGAIIENASKLPLDQFAKEAFFTPLGITRFEWRHVPVNRTTGQGNLRITARDAAAIGELFLNGGRAKQRRIVSEDWVAKSLASQVSISASDPYADYYGYMWYTKAEAIGDHSVIVHFASGNGGNKIYVIPSLRMVVAITSSAYGRGYGQRRSQDILLKILAAAHP